MVFIVRITYLFEAFSISHHMLYEAATISSKNTCVIPGLLVHLNYGYLHQQYLYKSLAACYFSYVFFFFFLFEFL